MSHVEIEFDAIGISLTSTNGSREKIFVLNEDDFSTPELGLIFRVMRDLHPTSQVLQ